MNDPPEKVCGRCGRRFTWRRRWARTWNRVRYCSARCRRGRLGREDRRLEVAIRDLLAARASDASVCPSEAARAVGGGRWRELLERSRAAARRLAAAGEIEIAQRGRRVDPSTARGAIRLRRARHPRG